MSPDLIGVMIAVGFIVPTIVLVRKYGIGDRAWPLFLASLPVYYMLFGVLALDGTAILKEMLFGIPYIVTGLLVWRIQSTVIQYVIAIAWLSHGIYDWQHDLLFVNPGVFSWYPAFCAVVDIAVGCYLIVCTREMGSE